MLCVPSFPPSTVVILILALETGDFENWMKTVNPGSIKMHMRPIFFPLVQMSGGITDNPKSIHETAEGPQIPCESLHPTVGAVTGSQILNSWMEIAW